MFHCLQLILESAAAAAVGYALRTYVFAQNHYEVYFNSVLIKRDELHRKVIDVAVAYLFGWLIIKLIVLILSTSLAIFCCIFGPILRLLRAKRGAPAVEFKQSGKSRMSSCCCFLFDVVVSGLVVFGAYVGFLHKYTYEIYYEENKLAATAENFIMVQVTLAVAMGWYFAILIRGLKSLLCFGAEEVTTEIKVEVNEENKLKKQ